jgi:hypothetical protein
VLASTPRPSEPVTLRRADAWRWPFERDLSIPDGSPALDGLVQVAVADERPVGGIGEALVPVEMPCALATLGPADRGAITELLSSWCRGIRLSRRIADWPWPAFG